MKSLLYIYLYFFAVSSVYADYALQDAINVIALIKNSKSGREQFCSKTSSNNIRVSSGKHCKDPLKAALAVGACTNFSDFDKSQCRGNSLNTLSKVNPDLSIAATQTIMVQLNQTSGEAVCAVINNFLPQLQDGCKLLVSGSMPSSSGKLTQSSLNKLLEMTDKLARQTDNVQAKKSAQFLELISGISVEIKKLNREAGGNDKDNLGTFLPYFEKIATQAAKAFETKDTLSKTTDINALSQQLHAANEELDMIKKAKIPSTLTGDREALRKLLLPAVATLEELLDDAIASVSVK